MKNSSQGDKVVVRGTLAATLLMLGLVGCATTGINRGQMNIISSEEEVKIGQEMSVEVAKQFPVYNNATITSYAQAVGDKIVRNSDRKDIAYHFGVINKNDANAFSLPGGYVYTYTGLMLTAADEAEFAAVLAHETAHVAARHSTERLTQQYGYDFLSGLVLGTDPNSAAKIISDLAATGGFLKYSRDDEFEADRLGARYLHDAGYDPQAMVSFLEKIQALEASQPGRLETWLMTHPSTSERLTRVKAEIAKLSKLASPVRNEAVYATIKAQLPR